MEPRDTDDNFDKLMLLLANYSKPIANEWLKICQWFLTLAALSFLSRVAEHRLFNIVLGISGVILWIYFFFHYNKLWYTQYNKIVRKNRKWAILKRTIVYLLGAIITLAIISSMLYLSMLFGAKAALLLHPGK